MIRACDALTLEEEKHMLLGKAHSALAAQFRLASVEESQEAVSEASTSWECAKKELLVSLDSASSEVLADRATMLSVLRANDLALARCSQELQQDPEMRLAAKQGSPCQRSESSRQAGDSTTRRAWGALNLGEERNLLIRQAHLVLAAKCRLESVEETDKAIIAASRKRNEPWWELRDAGRAASDEVLAERATMLAVLPGNGNLLQFCSQEFRNDPEIVLAACRAGEDGWSFRFASPELRADREFVLQAVRLAGFALDQVSPELQEDREVVLAALPSQPLALRDAGKTLRRDRDLILASLRQTTRRYVLKRCGETILDSLFDEDSPVSDKELILEGARVDADVLRLASLELRQDKDFVLEVMRRVHAEELRLCYGEADDYVKKATPFEDFQGACNSVLASPGEEAPVLTVTVHPAAAPISDSSQKRELLPAVSCEVSLLSGASFSCDLATADPHPSSRLAAPPPMNVSQLAKVVKAELLAHTQAEQPPARVFILFNKRDAKGDTLSVPVTPWDWNRPITDFC